MKKTLLLFFFCAIAHLNTLAQNPGGATGNIYWLSSEKDPDSIFIKSSQLINFYQSISLNDKNIIEEIKSSKITDEISVFIAFRPSFPQKG